MKRTLSILGSSGSIGRQALKVAECCGHDVAAITVNAACIAGVGDRLGALSPGKDADVVVMDGHPFDWRSRVTHVLIDGQEVE